MKMSDEQFKTYSENPVAMDSCVRDWFKLPFDRYFTVSVWPITGEIRVNDLTLTFKAHKVSKSDQS